MSSQWDGCEYWWFAKILTRAFDCRPASWKEPDLLRLPSSRFHARYRPTIVIRPWAIARPLVSGRRLCQGRTLWRYSCRTSQWRLRKHLQSQVVRKRAPSERLCCVEHEMRCLLVNLPQRSREGYLSVFSADCSCSDSDARHLSSPLTVHNMSGNTEKFPTGATETSPRPKLSAR